MSPSALFVTTIPLTLEAFLLPFAELLRDQGWRVDALANGASSYEPIKGAFDRRFDVRWRRNPLAPSNLMGTATHIRELVGRVGYDVVHVHTPVAAFVTRRALRSLPDDVRPTVMYTAHGFHFYEGQRALTHLVYRTLEARAARWTDMLVTMNEMDYDAARTFGTIDPADVRFVPGVGVDVEVFSPLALTDHGKDELRRSIDVDPDEFLVAMVAEFSPTKRHELALEAFALLDDPRAVLVLIGSGPRRAAVERIVARLGLDDRVIFLGQRPDVDLLLCAADVALLTSEREGLPRSVLEAMSCGTPVVGTRTRGIVDAIGDDSLVAAHDDAAGVAEILRGLVGDRERLARLGKEARGRALAEFSLSAVLDAYEDLYTEAFDRRRIRRGDEEHR